MKLKGSFCEGGLKAQQLVKVYRKGSKPALNGLTMSIREGEVFGLLGPNGAGKTTAISIMNTLLKPTSGSISVCGIDALRYPAQVREFIGFVPQEIALYQNLTVRGTLTSLPDIRSGKERPRGSQNFWNWSV
jgi:ABC-2 type transport system ATP-binding protein